jgi:hypothetical protein
MTSAVPNLAAPRSAAEAAELERYGIVRVPTEIFTWGGFRYTNAGDAIAAARRAETR